MDDTATTTPAAATAAGCDAASSEKTINAADNKSSGVSVAVSVNNSVKLLIKSSNQQYDDVDIESDLCWTVKRLKKQLSHVYPGKPNINDQKLIYSGKLLDDSQKLSEVIRSYKDVYQQHHIFHLVCANKQPIKPLLKAVASKAATATHQDARSSSNANELRQRHVGAQTTYQQAPPQPQPQPQQQQLPAQPLLQQQATAAATMTNANPQLAMQQQMLHYNAWVQQVYAYYMQQWIQRSTAADAAGAAATGAAGAAGPPAALPMPAWPMPHTFMQNPVIPNSLIAPAQPQPLAVPANEPQPQLAPQRPAARQVEAGNFPNVQEEPEMRDWLDSFFTFTRLVIFITVLYFNSSPMRCLFVLLIASIIYLYHIGVLRRRPERNNNNINRNNNAANDAAAFAVVQEIQRMMDAGEQNVPPPPQPPPPQPNEAAADNAAATPPASGIDNAAAVAAEAAAVEPPNANNTVIAVVRTFVITFFTSLLPEAPAL